VTDSNQPITAPDQPVPLEAPLTLKAPEPAAAVATTQAPGMVTLDQTAIPGLDVLVDQYAQALITVDPNSPDFAKQADQVRTMGDADIRQASQVSNRLLEKSVAEMKRTVGDGAKIPQTLLELRRTVEKLDPSETKGVKKLLGIIPKSNKITDYFQRYESSQQQLNAILMALYNGQDELRKDNADLDQEKVNLWETMQRLRQYIYVAEKLDSRLAAKVDELRLTDPERPFLYKNKLGEENDGRTKDRRNTGFERAALPHPGGQSEPGHETTAARWCTRSICYRSRCSGRYPCLVQDHRQRVSENGAPRQSLPLSGPAC